jgi:hypothetical protein
MRRTLLTAVVMALVWGAAMSAAKFISVWKAPDVDRLNFAGKKIAAVVIAQDQGLQVSAEEELARQLTARGLQGVASYRIVPREVLSDKAAARGFLERSGVQGLVVMRLVSADKEVTYTPDVWVSSMYADPWSYYAYGWSSAIVGVNRREDLVVTIETLIYDMTKLKLVWAGVSEKTNPKDAQKFVKELVGNIVSEMRKEGFVPKGTP